MYVCKIGGAQCHRPSTIDDLARTLRDRQDEPWLLVHGAGPQLDIALDAVAGPIRKVQGLRVTSEAAAHVVQKQMDLVGAELAQELRKRGVHARHVPASEKRLSAQVKSGPDGTPLGRVGQATGFDATGLQAAEGDRHEVQVVTPVGWDAEGPLNVNADEGALAVADACGAKRLVLLTDVEGVRSGAGKALRSLDVDAARALVADGVAQGGMVPKLQNAVAALGVGIGEVRIGDARALTTGGTLITAGAVPGA